MQDDRFTIDPPIYTSKKYSKNKKVSAREYLKKNVFIEKNAIFVVF